jgi:hypothetical protein
MSLTCFNEAIDWGMTDDLETATQVNTLRIPITLRTPINLITLLFLKSLPHIMLPRHALNAQSSDMALSCGSLSSLTTLSQAPLLRFPNTPDLTVFWVSVALCLVYPLLALPNIRAAQRGRLAHSIT